MHSRGPSRDSKSNKTKEYQRVICGSSNTLVPHGTFQTTTCDADCNAVWMERLTLSQVDGQILSDIRWTVPLCPLVIRRKGSDGVCLKAHFQRLRGKRSNRFGDKGTLIFSGSGIHLLLRRSLPTSGASALKYQSSKFVPLTIMGNRPTMSQ